MGELENKMSVYTMEDCDSSGHPIEIICPHCEEVFSKRGINNHRRVIEKEKEDNQKFSRFNTKNTKGWKRACYARHHEACKNKNGKCQCPCHVTNEVKCNE